MRYCRVIGSVTAAVKHPSYVGRPLMIVQALDENDQDQGSSFLAIDTVQAGPGDKVLVLSEGNGVGQILGSGPDRPPIRSLIVGIVDAVDVPCI